MKKIIYIIAVLFISFFIAECCLRLFTPFYGPSLRAVVKEEAYQSAQTALRVAPGAKFILRKEDLERNIDVIAVGDSTTFGTLLKESEAWPAQLAQRMGLDVLNLGLGSLEPCGYNYVLKMALTRLPEAPSVVLYGVFANDIAEEPTCEPDSHYRNVFIWEDEYRYNFAFHLRKFREWLFQHSVAYHLVKRMLTFRYLVQGKYFKPIFFKKDGLEFAFTPTYYWEECLDLRRDLVARKFEGTLIKIQKGKEIAEDAGSKFIVVLLPFKEQIYTPYLVKQGLLPANAYHQSYDSLYDELLLRLKEMDIETVDLRPPFRKMAEQGIKLFWTLDGHFNLEGNRLIAAILAERLGNINRE